MRLLRCAVLVCAAAGCGQTNDLGLLPVGGRVLLDDAPLAGAALTFHPIDGSPETGGVGESGPDGVYSVSNMRNDPGLLPGEYKVTVMKWLKKDGSALGAGESYIDTPDLVRQLAAAYSSPETTPLRVTVSGSGPMPDLMLYSRPKKGK